MNTIAIMIRPIVETNDLTELECPQQPGFGVRARAPAAGWQAMHMGYRIPVRAAAAAAAAAVGGRPAAR